MMKYNTHKTDAELSFAFQERSQLFFLFSLVPCSIGFITVLLDGEAN